MKYLLLIATDPKYAPADQASGEKMMAEYLAFTQLIKDSGEYVGGEQLDGRDSATTVRIREGNTAITDGPFAETTEQIGGYYIVDVPHLDRALEIAALIPGARDGAVEVRPIVEM
ncbi:MAG: YciI family protein [Mycobacteriales bacterium]